MSEHTELQDASGGEEDILHLDIPLYGWFRDRKLIGSAKLTDG